MAEPWEENYQRPKSIAETARESQFAQNFVESGKNYFGGIAHAVTHPKETAGSFRDLGLGVIEKMGAGQGPHAQYADAVGQFLADRYGSIDKAQETFYRDPVGFLGDVSLVFGGASGIARGAGAYLSGARLPQAAQAVRTGADILGAASAVTDPLRLGYQAVTLPLRPARIPERLYQSALKPGPGTYSTQEVRSMTGTGLREQLPVSEAGVRKLWNLVGDLHQQQQAVIDAGSQAAVTIDPVRVAQRVEDIRPVFQQQVNPKKSMKLLDRSKAEFLESHGGYGPGYAPIPASEAQAIKTGTYRQLKKSYGELKNASIEAQKALARGIREELIQAFPELASLAERESSLMGLSEALEHAVRRGMNHQIFGIGTPLAVGAAADVTGSGAAGAVLGGLRGVIDNPVVKSKLAIAIRRSQMLYPKRFRPESLSNALSRIGNYTEGIRRYQEELQKKR